MISFKVNSNGTINIKPKGKIHYYFKGINMHPETGVVVMSADHTLTVCRDSDQQLTEFVKIDSNWLLKENTTSSSVLYGTRFIFD